MSDIRIPIVVTIAAVIATVFFGHGDEGVVTPAPPEPKPPPVPQPSPDPTTTLPGATPIPSGSFLPLPTRVPTTPTDLAIAHRQIMTVLQSPSTEPRLPTNLPLLDPDLMIAIGTRLKEAGFAAEGDELITWADCVRLARDDFATVEARRAQGFYDELSYFSSSCGPYHYAPSAPSELDKLWIRAYEEFIARPFAIGDVAASDDLERRLREAGFATQANDLRRRRNDLGNLLFMQASGALSGGVVQQADIQRASETVRAFDTHGFPELSAQLRQAIIQAQGRVQTQHAWRCRARGGCAVQSRPSQTPAKQTILGDGELVDVMGRTTDGIWLEVRLNRSPYAGFVLASALEEVGPRALAQMGAYPHALAPRRAPGWHIMYHRDPSGHLRPSWVYG